MLNRKFFLLKKFQFIKLQLTNNNTLFKNSHFFDISLIKSLNFSKISFPVVPNLNFNDLSLIKNIDSEIYENILDFIKDNDIQKTHFKKLLYTFTNSSIFLLYDKLCNINILKNFNDIVYIVSFFNTFNFKNLDIKIFVIENKKNKNILSENKVLSYKNVNSGFCLFVNLEPQYMCLHRNEEIKKVLIHELIHYLCLDFKKSFNCSCSKKFCINNVKLGNNSFKILYNEGFVEFYATIINLIFLLHNNKKEKFFLNSLLIEFYNAIYQVIKIFKFYGITKFSMLFEKNNFNQESNVFSYFFIKLVLLFNLNTLLPDVLNFIWIKDNYIKLFNTLCVSFNDEKFINFIDYILQLNLNDLDNEFNLCFFSDFNYF